MAKFKEVELSEVDFEGLSSELGGKVVTAVNVKDLDTKRKVIIGRYEGSAQIESKVYKGNYFFLSLFSKLDEESLERFLAGRDKQTAAQITSLAQNVPDAGVIVTSSYQMGDLLHFPSGSVCLLAYKGTQTKNGHNHNVYDYRLLPDPVTKALPERQSKPVYLETVGESANAVYLISQKGVVKGLLK